MATLYIAGWTMAATKAPRAETQRAVARCTGNNLHEVQGNESRTHYQATTKTGNCGMARKLGAGAGDSDDMLCAHGTGRSGNCKRVTTHSVGTGRQNRTCTSTATTRTV